MLIRIQVDDDGVQRMLARAEANAELRMYSARRVARKALDLVRGRTERGVDWEGNIFAKYSKRHAKRRAARGLRTHPPNLKFSGRMLRDLRAGVGRDSGGYYARLHFHSARSRQIARYHNSLADRKKMPLRRFLDFKRGTPWHRELAREAADALATQIRQGR